MNKDEIDEQLIVATICVIFICCCCLFLCSSREHEIRFPTQDNTDDHLTDIDSQVQLTGTDTDAPIETIWE